MQDKIVWHGFVPETIKALYKAGHANGSFDSACLSLDISGFTSMSSALNKFGKQGAETISGVLNACFALIIREITLQEGIVCFFAGDAIMAIFNGKKKVARAKAVAQKICRFFSKHGNMETALGKYAIAVRLGISEGPVTWSILGDNHDKTCCFGGQAFAKAVDAQQRADKNSCYYANTDTMLSLDTEAGVSFSDVATEAKEGEFRAVYSVFCRFIDSCCIDINDETTNSILELCVTNGACFNGYDCTDKGNTFLVFFGAPHAVEHIEKHIASFISELLSKFGDSISIAVELGSLFTGKIGSSRVSTYTCIGEAINLSAHVCIVAQPGQVLFGETAALTLKDQFAFSKPFNIHIKKGTVKVFSITDIKNELKSEQKIIGYEKEVGIIRECIENLCTKGTGSRLYLWGKAGMGKSSLISMIEEISKNNHCTCWCMSSDNILQESLLPIRKFFRQSFDCTSYNRFTDSFNNFVLAHAQKALDTTTLNEFKRITILLKHLIGEKEAQQEPELLDSNDKLLTIALTLRSFIKNLAKLNPIVLIFEDLQWMDKDTKNLIELLHRDWGYLPILMVVTGRPDKRLLSKTRKLHNNDDIMHVRLKQFSLKTTKQMITSILAGPAGKSVIEYIYSKSKGVPFFIEQYTQFLVMHDFLTKENGSFELNSIPESLPVSVTSVITAIIDKLEPSLKKSVNIASVLGSDFYTNIYVNLISASNADENKNQNNQDHEKMLIAGAYQRIWKKKTNEIYTFLNRLIRDVAYSIQLSEILNQLHIAAARLIEQEANKNPDFYADAVYHYEQGNLPIDAARCSEQAAIHFMDFSLEEAEKFAEICVNNSLLAYNEGSPELIRPLILLSDILNQRGKYRKSIEKLKQVLLIIEAKSRSGSRDHIKVLINLGEAYKGISRYKKAHVLLQKAKKLCLAMPETPAQILVKLNECEFMAYIDEGNIEKSFEILEESDKLVQLPGVDPMSIVTVPYNYGIAYWTCGKYNEALTSLEKSMKMQNDFYGEDLPPIVWTYNNIGAIYNEMQETEKALENLDKAFSIAKHYLGIEHPLCATILNNIAVSHDIMGNYIKALEFGTQALEIRLSIYGEKHLDTGTSINNIGYVYMEKEDYANARKYFCMALEIYLSTAGMDSMYSARCHLNLGKVELADGNNDIALEYMEKAKVIFNKLEHEPGLIETEALIKKASHHRD